jgi:hypothetical protein
MRHFIVYRDPDYWDDPLDPLEAFSAVTTKRPERTEGGRIWILSRDEHSNVFFLCSTFVVTAVGRDERLVNPNWMVGSSGQVFGRSFVVSESSWWYDVMKATGGMRWGLTELRSRRAIDALSRIARSAKPPRRRARLSSSDRFVPSVLQARVERTAVQCARRFLSRRGWVVRSVEHEGRGFDLLCVRAGSQLHVEVKGCSGREASFGLTANELVVARTDPEFLLVVVTSALSRPVVVMKTSEQMLRQFTLEPRTWFAHARSGRA